MNLTDAEGSVLTSLSSSAVLGEQIYGPYGNQRYAQGTIGTDKGYTGQFQDAISGFDYYNARYYDPVMGQFLSADSVQGNMQGMDPYSYVDGNPETLTDPTGHCGVSSFANMVDCENAANVRREVQSRAVTSTTLQQITKAIVTNAAKAASGQFWLWVVVAVLLIILVIVFIALLFFAKSKSKIPPNGKPVETRIKKYFIATDQGIANDLKGYAQKANTGDNTHNFGAADLFIKGKANPDKEHQQAVFGDLGGHTEELIIRWAEGLLKSAKSRGIDSVRLVLFTFKAPCSNLCAPNLRNNVWRDQLAQAAGFSKKDYGKVTIVVYTQNNNPGNGANPWH
jgi:RHS repeat-associated protein